MSAIPNDLFAASGAQGLGARFAEAFGYAFRLHHGQRRKGSETAYIAHLMAVCELVLEMGGDEDEAIAALLHDAVEDQGGQPVLEAIRARFGEQVARTVWGCSDSDRLPKPPWRARKEAYLARLPGEPASVRRVSLADKIHNARDVVISLRQHGGLVWRRFQGGRDGTIWYYRSLVAIYRAADDSVWVDELERTVNDMEHLANLVI
jgi:(p)ppGpp synthase/HD superfamily hydrolase